MDNKKKLIGLIAGLACILLLVVLLLTNCGSEMVAQTPEEISTAATLQETTAETTVETTEETTEATEETTEATEETTEATEDDTSGGRSTPGGTSGFVGSVVESTDSETDDESGNSSTEATQPVVEDPGTQTNAYIEVLGDIPDTVDTVKIPADQTIYYNIFNAGGTVLTIEDPDAYVVYNGETYPKAEDKSGIVTIALEEGEEDTPICLELGSNAAAKEVRSFTLKYAMPLGSPENPEELKSLEEEIVLTLEAGDVDGYFYTYKAPQVGTVSFTLNGVDPAETDVEIILTKVVTVENEQTEGTEETEETVQTTTVTAKLSETEGDTVSMDVEGNDLVTIQVLVTTKDTAAKVTFSGRFDPKEGTTEETAIPFASITEDITQPFQITIPAGATVYYSANANESIMTLTAEETLAQTDVTVVHNDTEYTPVSGTVTLPAQSENEMYPCIFRITNKTGNDATYTVVFTYPVGHMNNPAELKIGANTAVVGENAVNYYYYTWKNASDVGVLTIRMNSENWSYTINNLTAGAYGDMHWSDDEVVVSSESIAVNTDDEILLIVNTYNPEDMWNTPAGEVRFTVSFMLGDGTEENPYQLNSVLQSIDSVGTQIGEVTVPAGQTVYCTARITNMIMTLTGSGISDTTVTGNGTVHKAENDVISFAVDYGDNFHPPVFAITNSADVSKTYQLKFGYPVGTYMNPDALNLEDGGANSAEVDEGIEGYFFDWIATANGTLMITMDETQNINGWAYSINNLTTSQSSDIHTWIDDPIVLSDSMTVTAGNHYRVTVNTCSDRLNAKSPAGTVYFTASFTPESVVDTVGAFTLRTPTVETTETPDVEMEEIEDAEPGVKESGTVEEPDVEEEADLDTEVEDVESKQESVTTAESEIDAEPEIEVETETCTETENVTETESQKDPEAKAESEEEVVIEPEAEPETEAKTENESTTETEAEKSPKGTKENPKRFPDMWLTDPDAQEPNAVEVSIEEGSEGYYYIFTAKQDGVLTVDIVDYPEEETIRTDITMYVRVLEGEVKEEDMFSLWNFDEDLQQNVESEKVSIRVVTGDRIIIHVTAAESEDAESCMAAKLTVYAVFTGDTEKNAEVSDTEDSAQEAEEANVGPEDIEATEETEQVSEQPQPEPVETQEAAAEPAEEPITELDPTEE